MRKKKSKIILGICWLAFIIWEIIVMNWANAQDTAYIRIDLVIILPVLILFTIFMLFRIFRDKKKKKEKERGQTL
ncbi:hypothetical protein [Formosa algae]|uniref:Uncharacterized protein YpmB n=1 Tax=Formosa algae TaxID=225843 RepID=A0A9X1CBW5_9FLAO|nr:hypothetical protein [Formosa algae]MBP1840452.1 uncharacterized protein YpmB [Formosa algae]MDQ0336944.1 uncharacterized protein YpmB [Formosa algae]OEI80831.1 hypothetical protein AST99_07205 [Formosa algae]PNW28165.1 hypothetical protein BKP44_09830 [Formosa algae]